MKMSVTPECMAWRLVPVAVACGAADAGAGAGAGTVAGMGGDGDPSGVVRPDEELPG